MFNILYIVWDHQCELGIPIIDEQHRGIVSTINSLYYLNKISDGARTLKPVLIMLEQYAQIHFGVEQQLMKETNYPHFEEHLLKHKEFYEKTMSYIDEINRYADPIEVLRFLKEWWLGHINIEDRQYVPYLQKLMAKID